MHRKILTFYLVTTTYDTPVPTTLDLRGTMEKNAIFPKYVFPETFMVSIRIFLKLIVLNISLFAKIRSY